MRWEGLKIKEFAKNKKLSLQKVADAVGVSRQTVNDWIKGQIPKGNHLLLLCKYFNKNPDIFFISDIQNYISVPVHRQRMNSKITKSTQEAALSLSKEYLNFFRNHKNSEIVPVIRIQERDIVNARKIANDLRALAGIAEDKPIDYKHTFVLTEKLGIHVIFRDFPGSIKSYAFYTKISDHRIVFVNNNTNIIDLIFPLLHETVHAVRDELTSYGGYDQAEEEFCDLVANFIQFPESYVSMVYNTVKGLNIPVQINKLKYCAKINHHSLHGIIKAMKLNSINLKLNVGGADSNIRKEFPTIAEIIFEGDDARKFIQNLMRYSNNFFEVIMEQADTLSNRKLAEILGIESTLDAQEIQAELLNCKQEYEYTL